jgi:predicted CXXCH cytochrome family protein
MKKLLILVAAAALMLIANVAMASVVGTPHEYGGATTYGQCQVCHVPHAAKFGKRLWASSVSATAADGTWSLSDIGKLCGTCHDNGALQAVNNVNGAGPHQMTAAAYAPTSHGRTWATLGGAIHDTADAAQTKPYTTGTHIEAGLMECTSCHNPHQDGLRPFLRPGVLAGSTSGFCKDCHNRYNTAVGVNNTSVSWNGARVSMHPVNVPVTDIGGNGGTTFHAPAAGVGGSGGSLAGLVSSNNPWTLGGKGEKATSALDFGAGATNNLGCATCHAVHNPATPALNAGDKGLHLLAIDNSGNTGQSLLCQGCHGGPAAGGAFASSVGTTVGDHPINVLSSRAGPDITRWTTVNVNRPVRYERHVAATAEWPQPGNAESIMCTSCHSAHAGRSGIKLTRTGGNAADWCVSCHADPAPAGHHSYSGNYATSAIACDNCHTGGAGGSAHNGFDFTTNLAVANNASQLCEMCHVGAVAPDPVYSLDNAGGVGTKFVGNAGTFQTIPNPYLANPNNAGHVATHYTGAFVDSANSINVKRNSWSVAGGFAKFGAAVDTFQKVTDATGTTLICESCHSVRYNMGAGAGATATSGYNNNLLLQDYKDDDAAAGAGYGTGTGLCVACHNQNNLGNSAVGPVADVVAGPTNANLNVPIGIHPMTGWSITKAQDAGRLPTTLLTGPAIAGDGGTGADTAASYADHATRTLHYPAGDTMNCDSCHKPHVADTNGTWKPAYKGAAVSVILEIAGPGAGAYDNLCKDCHSY